MSSKYAVWFGRIARRPIGQAFQTSAVMTWGIRARRDRCNVEWICTRYNILFGQSTGTYLKITYDTTQTDTSYTGVRSLMQAKKWVKCLPSDYNSIGGSSMVCPSKIDFEN